MFRESKKGFTLVELLAVFVILGIIAAIAISGTNGLKENAARKSFTESVKFALTAAQNYYSSTPNGFDSISIDSEEIQIENKSQFKRGTFKYDEDTGKIKAIGFSNGEFCANGPVDDLVVTDGECKIATVTFSIKSRVEYIKSSYSGKITGSYEDKTFEVEIGKTFGEIFDEYVIKTGYIEDENGNEYSASNKFFINFWNITYNSTHNPSYNSAYARMSSSEPIVPVSWNKNITRNTKIEGDMVLTAQSIGLYSQYENLPG